MKAFDNKWAIIFGGTGGFGFATAKYLAKKGMNIFIVHRDNRAALEKINIKFKELLSEGVEVSSININACDEENYSKIITSIENCLKGCGQVRLFLHCISDGNLNEVIDLKHNNNQLVAGDYLHTFNTMGLNFIEWSKILVNKKILQRNSRIIGLTSEGSDCILPNYAAVSAAKASMESFCKYLAVKLAPLKITVNLINAGITETPALLKFPNYEVFLEKAKKRNPSGRLTRPEDIAKVVFLLCMDEASWITGDIIRVDGGEQLLHLH